jgi:hypothetical protein
LILSRIPNKALGIGETDIGGGGSITLVVGNDFDTVMLPNSDAGVGSPEIDSDGRPFLRHLSLSTDGKDRRRKNTQTKTKKEREKEE